MQVVKEQYEDAGEQDENGYYEYYYAGVSYRFCFENEMLLVCQEHSQPTVASMTHYMLKKDRKWRPQRFDSVPYNSPSFRQAVKYLVENEGIREVEVFLDEWVRVDLIKLGEV
jgi:hypothetical protein